MRGHAGGQSEDSRGLREMEMIQDLDYPNIVRSTSLFLFSPPRTRAAVPSFSPNMFDRLHEGQTWGSRQQCGD